MGANSRTYKFALGEALLQQAREGADEIPLSELAVPYAMSLVRHLDSAPQSPGQQSRGEADFLTVAEREADESKGAGRPTDRLLQSAMTSMPAMVMQKFHNLSGWTEVEHRFYEVTGAGRHRIVRLTPALKAIAQSEQSVNLRGELAARWSIVESSFVAGVGRSLLSSGLVLDSPTMALTDKLRRRSVSGVADAVIGFQHGRCLICGDDLLLSELVAVDHVFPFALMQRSAAIQPWAGPDLDAVWNLAPAHAVCNAAKSAAMPTDGTLRRLVERNDAIMGSPHPLRRTLELTLLSSGLSRTSSWAPFVRAVRDIL